MPDMNDLSVEAILDRSERHGYGDGNDPMAQVLRLRSEQPCALGDLVSASFRRPLKHATFINVALQLMDDDTYVATINEAWTQARAGNLNDAVEMALDSATHQCPDVFTGNWECLLTAPCTDLLSPAARMMAWRALDTETARRWLGCLPAAVTKGTVEYERAFVMTQRFLLRSGR